MIHEASHVKGMPHEPFTGMLFCISILGKDAKVLTGCCRVWISGSVMNWLITVNNKKTTKFVFGETIHHKLGWISQRYESTTPTEEVMMPMLPTIAQDALSIEGEDKRRKMTAMNRTIN